ncbi:MAG TPA: hypothetical protein VF530_22970 [Planctomycetota bacterium]
MLLLQGLRPVPALEELLDTTLVPLRHAAELARPLAHLRGRTASAAERELALAAEAESALGQRVLARLAERALPQDPALRAGRVFLPAEITGRPSKDECWVAYPGPAEVAPGTPVVCGDVFVGRVVELRPGARPAARVQLITHAHARVGAEVAAGAVAGAESEGPVFLTVGGLRVPRSRAEPRAVRLAAHQPSSVRLAGGLARVHELFADADEAAALADGFRLGTVRRAGERNDFWVEPELDYLDGLFHLALVLAPQDAPALAPVPAPLEDGRWLTTRALVPRDASPWRSTLALPLGHADGLREGAAVTSVGARLVGRLLAVGPARADVALLDDPGLHLGAVALVEGSEEPVVLGRLTALGRAGPGAVRMRWWVRVSIALAGQGEPVRARLFTSPGDPGLPGGLYLGSTLLPRAATAGEEREIVLTTGFEARELGRLFVRRALEGAP